MTPKPRLNKSNLGTILVNGKVIRAWSIGGFVFFRIHRARKVTSISLQDIYSNSCGQLRLPI